MASTEHRIITVYCSMNPRHSSHHKALDMPAFREFEWTVSTLWRGMGQNCFAYRYTFLHAKRQAFGAKSVSWCAMVCQGFVYERDNSAICVWPLEGILNPGWQELVIMEGITRRHASTNDLRGPSGANYALTSVQITQVIGGDHLKSMSYQHQKI